MPKSLLWLLFSATVAASEWQTYRWYQPTVERSFVVDTAASPLQYNHDSSIAWFGDRWFCLWNANLCADEGKPGQLNYQATSTDGQTWAEPVPAFASPDHAEPAVPCPKGTQWQPNLIVVNNELWAVWSQNSKDEYNGCYLSRLRSPEGKWENTRLLWDGSPEPLLDGVRWRVFPTQNPCILRSGRILAPVTLTGPVAKDVPEGIGSWWAREKRNSVIYTDDGGTTWQVSPGTIIPGRSWAQWEPTVWEAADGTVLMVGRNNDFRANKEGGAQPTQMLTWSESRDRGTTWAPLRFVPLETVASRMHVLPLPGDRMAMIHNDHPAGTFVQDRQNLALFFTQGKGVDFVAGPGISGWEPCVAYPQGWVRDSELLVSYSQGNQPRSIKVARVSPLPAPGTLSVLPRHRETPPVQPQAESDGWRFAGQQFLRSTSPVALGKVVTVTARFRGCGGGCLVDTRTVGQRSGFVVGLAGKGGELKPYVFVNSPEHNLFSNLTLDRLGWNTLTIRIDRAAGRIFFELNGQADEVAFQAQDVPDFSGPATVGLPFAPTSRIPGFVGTLGMLQIATDGQTPPQLRIAAGEPLSNVALPPELTANHRAVLVAGNGQRLVRITGDGSAGLELAPNERSQGDRVEIEARVRATGRGDTDILTVGDGDRWVCLGIRNGAYALVQGGQVASFPTPATNAWQTVSILTGQGETAVRVGGIRRTVPHPCQGTWVYLGKAYGTPRTLADAWPEFEVDLDHLRSRILP